MVRWLREKKVKDPPLLMASFIEVTNSRLRSINRLKAAATLQF